jgi:sterol desaturase/sphingolipid hydroxylase (fatty acid hydroxylase superfamily)
LWRFHAIHHSAEILTPITLYRVHCVELVINSMRSIGVLGGISGVFIYCFPGKISMIDIMGVSALSWMFNMVGSNLRHSSIRLEFGRFERYFISPAQHQIHHSSAKEHYDVNFGVCLAIWDRLFRTLIFSSEL